MNRCDICENYLTGLSEPRCKFCDFEWAKELVKDTWDILNEEDSWEEPNSIRNRLWAKGIECLSADIWADDNVAIIYGYGGNQERVADALGIHKKCVYVDPLHDVTILNLLEEKNIRKLDSHWDIENVEKDMVDKIVEEFREWLIYELDYSKTQKTETRGVGFKIRDKSYTVMFEFKMVEDDS